MVDFHEYKNYQFHIVDYIVFGGMIFFSTAVGFYMAFIRKPKAVESSTHRINEFLLGSRKMEAFPVAMSLIGSYISGVTILGTPPEIYNYGIQYSIITVSIAISSFLVAYIYLPVFTVLQVKSSYEYLEMRFHPVIRSIASFMFVMDEILFLPFVVYVPSLALSQVSGINKFLIGAVIASFCVLYTLLGGMKAVVYTDAWQIYMMFLSVVTVALVGVVKIGGPFKAIELADAGGRIFWNLNPSLYERLSLWSVIIGGTMYWLSFNSVNQTMVQRYMSLPTLQVARVSLFIFTLGMILFIGTVCLCGLLIYSTFAHCDPSSAKLIEKDDQMFPLYVMHVIGYLKGIPGLFVAGIFGAALSSLSVVLHSTALVLLEDVVRGSFKMELSNHAASYLVKTSICILGVLSFLLTYVLVMMDSVFSAATVLTSISAGVSFGLFTLGMIVPWSNTKGAAIGGLVSAILVSWIAFGSQAMIATGKVYSPKLPIDVSGCGKNVTLTPIKYPDQSEIFPLYRLSYYWINPIGVFTAVTVGSIASLFFMSDASDVSADLISPVVHRFLPEKCFESSITKRKQ